MKEYKSTLYLYERIFDTDSFSLLGDSREGSDKLQAKLCKLLGIQEIGNANLLNSICYSLDVIGVKQYINEHEIDLSLENKINRTIKFYKLLYGQINDQYFNGLRVAVKSFGITVRDYKPRLRKLLLLLGGTENEEDKVIYIKMSNITNVRVTIKDLFELIND